MNGAQWLVRTLREQGVEYAFVLCGNGLNPFLDACLDFGLKLIDVRNEQAAAYMADTWGGVTGRLGLAAVSSGPGHTNALTGLANAFWDGRPMMLLSGSSPSTTSGLDHFQELDQVAMAAPVTKYARRVHHVDLLPTELNNALSLAVSGRPGPVHLTIPVDVLSAEIDEQKAPRLRRGICQVRQSLPGDPDLVRDGVKLLARAERPFILVGSGAFYAQAWPALEAFARLTGIPILSHLWDRCCIERSLPEYVGVTNPELTGAYALLSKADLLLTLGARIDYRIGFGQPPVLNSEAKIIRVDVDPAELHRTISPEIGILGDVRSVLMQMTEEARRIGGWPKRAWAEEVRAAHRRFLKKWERAGHETECPMSGIQICRVIKKFLREDITFLLDGGNIGRWAHLLLFDRHPSHWFTCGASGVVGWGLPGAVAAKLARPDKPLLLLSGDGAAGFTLAEIETALRFGTPYVAVIAHDGAWGIVADGQPDGRHAASELGLIRFDRVAEALGARGVFIERPEQLEPAIREGLQADTVTFIHVPTQLVGVGRWEERMREKEGL